MVVDVGAVVVRGVAVDVVGRDVAVELRFVLLQAASARADAPTTPTTRSRRDRWSLTLPTGRSRTRGASPGLVAAGGAWEGVRVIADQSCTGTRCDGYTGEGVAGRLADQRAYQPAADRAGGVAAVAVAAAVAFWQEAAAVAALAA